VVERLEHQVTKGLKEAVRHRITVRAADRPAQRDQASVGALRAKGSDVDVSIRPRKEWARLYDQKQLAAR
jgi:hypothetical protein